MNRAVDTRLFFSTLPDKNEYGNRTDHVQTTYIVTT